jgi:formylglycine-generating enzyme required for sulfatase activity
MTRRLVQDLEMIQEVTARTTMKDHEQVWQDAIDAIKKDSRYQDMKLKPLVGLVPLGKDPQSHLWEFAHVPSGTVPKRGADGKLELGKDTGMVLVLIPGGSFEMGSKEAEDDEQPVHTVAVPSFFLSKYELTQGQWGRLAGKNTSTFQDDDRKPVESVIFDETRTACGWLGLHLPSEAEWEYAARSGGKEEKWAGTSKESELEDYAWYGENSDGGTLPIGGKKPNGLGLHDMSGNVWEWVQDCYHDSYKGAPTNGSAWESGKCGLRVLRGGAWLDYAEDARVARRGRGGPDSRYHYVGFRCVARPPQ